MLIFDGFENRDKAELFAEAVTQKFGLAATVFMSREDFDKVDMFPNFLDTPIVWIERPDTDPDVDFETECQIQVLGAEHGGVFAGT